MEYFYNPGLENTSFVFLLLHGTGGHEADLLFASQEIDIEQAVLGVRGEVKEGKHLRFFKRHADGQFDLTDLNQRTADFHHFLQAVSEDESLLTNKLIPVAYSNGANFAVNHLLHYPEDFHAAILFHPSASVSPNKIPNLKGKKIFISAGAIDTMVLPGESLKLKRQLETAGAEVTFHITDFGHELIEDELQVAKQWYQENFKH